MLNEYRNHVTQRAEQNLPPLPLDAGQTKLLCQLLIQVPAGEEDFLLDLFINRIPPGVDDAAKVKAGFLNSIVSGAQSCSLINPEKAVQLLGTMGGV